MDPNQVQQLLDSPDPSATAPPLSPVAPGSALAPLTMKALAGTPSPQPASALDSPDQAGGKNLDILRSDYTKANQQDGVPLDIDSGADTWTRLNVALRRATEDKVKYLQNKYGEGAVRLSSDNVPIFRVVDSATGKPKDVRETELGNSLEDFVDVAGSLPEIAGGFLAGRYGGGGGEAAKGVIPRLANILAMAAGSEGAGAVKDATVRAADKSPIDPSEIASSRAKMAVTDVGVGAAMAVPGMAVKAASKLASPFGEQNEVSKQFNEAVQYFKDKGIDLPMTPGETSGSQLLQRVEAMARQLPGSSTVFKGIVDEQNAAMARIQKIAMGGAQDQTQENVGSNAIGALAKKNESLEQQAAEAKDTLKKTGTSEIGKGITDATGSQVVNPQELGGQIRDTALAKRQAFQDASAADYEKVYSHPQAQQRVFDGGDLADKAKKLLSELPSKETSTEVPTGVLDAQGNEILRDETGAKIEKNFVPSGILPMLNDLAGSDGAKYRLGDLLKMRTEVSNQIAQGEAVPGVQTHYLNEIRKTLDSSIKEGLDALPDKSLKTAWETANANYAKGVQPFKQAGIQELFRDPEQAGFLGNNQVVDRAMSGAKGIDTMNAYKGFFGAASPEYAGVKRAIADKLLGTSMNTTGDAVDPVAFMRNLGQLSRTSPDVAKEVFGDKSGQLLGIARSMAAGDSGEMMTGRAWQQKLNGFVDPDEVNKLAASGDLTSQKLLDLVNKEKAVATQYRNGVLKAVGSGDFTGSSIKPSDFVRYFSTQGEPAEINQVLGQLNDRPDVLQSIRSKVAQDIFDRAYPAAQALDNPAMLSGEPRVLTQKGLQNALGDATQRERYKSILGADTYNDIENLTKFLAPRGVGERAFSAAGGLAAGQQIAGLIRGGDLKYVDRTVKNWLMATVYTHPAVRAWAGNTVVPNVNTAGFTRYLISSAPVVEALYHDFGEKKASDVMAEMNASINKSSVEGKPSQNGDFSDLLDGQ